MVDHGRPWSSMVFCFFLEMATGVTSNEEGEEARGGLLRGRFPLQMSKMQHPSCYHVASSSSSKIQLIDAPAARHVTSPHQPVKMEPPSTARYHGCRSRIILLPLQDSQQHGNMAPPEQRPPDRYMSAAMGSLGRGLPRQRRAEEKKRPETTW